MGARVVSSLDVEIWKEEKPAWSVKVEKSRKNYNVHGSRHVKPTNKGAGGQKVKNRPGRRFWK